MNYDGDPVAVGFAPNFILDGLKVMKEDIVTLGLTEGGRAGIIKGADDFFICDYAYAIGITWVKMEKINQRYCVRVGCKMGPRRSR